MKQHDQRILSATNNNLIFQKTNSLEDGFFHLLHRSLEASIFRRQLIHFGRQAFIGLCQGFHLGQFVLLKSRRRGNDDTKQSRNPYQWINGRMKDKRQEG